MSSYRRAVGTLDSQDAAAFAALLRAALDLAEGRRSELSEVGTAYHNGGVYLRMMGNSGAAVHLALPLESARMYRRAASREARRRAAKLPAAQ